MLVPKAETAPWGRAAKEPTHEFSEQRFNSLKSHMGSRGCPVTTAQEAMTLAFVPLRKGAA
jgi:hypothetical protein